MKKIINIIFIMVIAVITVIQVIEVIAQTPSAIASPTVTGSASSLQEGSVKSASSEASLIEKGEQKIKDSAKKIVTEFRNKIPKAIAGVVLEASKKVLKIKTSADVDYEVTIDPDLTKLYQIVGVQKKDLKVSDVNKNSYVIINGPIIDKTISANVIYQDEQYLVKAGKVTEINTEDVYIKVLTTDKDNYTLDIETSTKMQIMDSKTYAVETARLSKIKEGDTIHYVVKKTGEETELNRYPAEKILIIPQEYFIK